MFEVSSSIKTLVDGTIMYLDKIGNALTEESTTNTLVAGELQKIDGLTMDEIVRAGESIISSSSRSALFLSFSEEKRREMVFALLKK